MLDPYHRWLGIPKSQQPPTYYQLLGISPDETDREVIEEAALRQTSHVRTYQTGPYAEQCTAVLNEIARARATLLNPARRREYDAKQTPATPYPPPPPLPRPVAEPPGDDSAEVELPPLPPAAPGISFPAVDEPAPLSRSRRRGGLASLLYGVAYAGLLLAAATLTFRQALDSATPGADPPEVQPPEPPPPRPPVRLGTRVQGQETVVRAVAALPPDGQRFLTAGGVLFGAGGARFDCSVYLWDLKRKEVTRTFRGPDAPLSCLAVSADGSQFLAGSGTYQPDMTGQILDCRARLWDVGLEQPRKLLEGHTAPLTGVAFVPGAKKAVSCGEDFTARLWDLESGKQERLLEKLSGTPRGIAVAPDGKEALIGCVGGWLRLWDLSSGLERGTEERLRDVLAVAYGPEGWRAVGLPEMGRDLGPVVRGDGSGGKLRRGLESAPRTALCWTLSADGSLAACGSHDGQVVVWECASGRELQRFRDAGRPVLSIALYGSRQGEAVLAGTADGAVWHWPLSRR